MATRSIRTTRRIDRAERYRLREVRTGNLIEAAERGHDRRNRVTTYLVSNIQWDATGADQFRKMALPSQIVLSFDNDDPCDPTDAIGRVLNDRDDFDGWATEYDFAPIIYVHRVLVDE